jgi:AraC-like DNA-binding protein
VHDPSAGDHVTFLTRTVEFESASLSVRAVRCRAPVHGCGATEYSSGHTLVLPQSGVFVKHDGPNVAFVADAGHALFFTAHRPYRVSHPAAGGDTCLALEFTPTALLEALGCVDPAAADTPETPFRVGGVLLPPRAVTAGRVLWHRLRRCVASPLEVEETARALVGAAITAGRRGAPVPRRRPRREASRRAEIVRATHTAIASRPAEPWSLEALARHAHCSPFHLAHVFREDVGLPVHRYLLRARLTAALDAVLDSNRSLSAIGLDAGFSHHSHFTSAFRRTFGVTPSSLRCRAVAGQVAELRKFLTAGPSTVR